MDLAVCDGGTDGGAGVGVCVVVESGGAVQAGHAVAVRQAAGGLYAAGDALAVLVDDVVGGAALAGGGGGIDGAVSDVGYADIGAAADGVRVVVDRAVHAGESALEVVAVGEGLLVADTVDEVVRLNIADSAGVARLVNHAAGNDSDANTGAFVFGGVEIFAGSGARAADGRTAVIQAAFDRRGGKGNAYLVREDVALLAVCADGCGIGLHLAVYQAVGNGRPGVAAAERAGVAAIGDQSEPGLANLAVDGVIIRQAVVGDVDG